MSCHIMSGHLMACHFTSRHVTSGHLFKHRRLIAAVRYILQIRCLLETACPVWNGSIIEADITKLERVQKSAFRIILFPNYISYNDALNKLNMSSLEERRFNICLSFAKKLEKSSKFQAWFDKPEKTTRQSRKYITPYARTTSYKKLPLVYLTMLLDNE
jgi:hypothetical protein